jgi:hypothetical protein
VPIRILKHQGLIDLIVPPLVIEEFDRNRPRAEMAVTTSVLDRLKILRRELREYAGEAHEQIWLAETSQHIPLVNTTAPQNFREIDELLRAGTIARLTEVEYSRAAKRGVERRAPFNGEKNSTADALIIETYASAVAAADAEEAYAFVTSNHKDFSFPNGDQRLPHPDLTNLFDGVRSHFVYKVEGLHDLLISQLGDEYLEEYHEVELLIDGDEEPRTLAEIVEAEAEYFDRVWYVRSIVHEDDRDLPIDIRSGMMSARARIEGAYGKDNLMKPIGPGHDEAWQYGYISGKLATLRWVLGSEWDFLDT